MKIKFSFIFIFVLLAVYSILVTVVPRFYLPKEPCIILFFSGRLGNQLFQYAAAYEFASIKKLKIYIIMDDAKSSNDLVKYGIFEKKSAGVDTAIIKYNFMTSLAIKLGRLNIFGNQVVKITNDNFFIKLAKSSSKIYYMRSTFEALTYFRGVSDEIKTLYDTDRFINNKTKEKIKILGKKNSVCIHTRLTDFTLLGWNIDFNYYKRAISKAKEVLSNPEFYIFSDDIKEAKNIFKDYKYMHYVSDKKFSAIDDFTMLSNCRNLIITNSTYSWWAAFLNKNNGLIIAPYDFTNNNKNHSKEYYKGYNKSPQSWFLIQNDNINN